jgi:hypothetical protein
MIPSPAATPVDLIHLGPTSIPRRRVSPLSAPNTLPLCSFIKFIPRNPFLNARVDVTQQAFFPVAFGAQHYRLPFSAILGAFVDLSEPKRHFVSLDYLKI